MAMTLSKTTESLPQLEDKVQSTRTCHLWDFAFSNKLGEG